MPYRLIAADIDGTLVNSRTEITPLTKQVLHEATEKGVIFAIASGRSVNALTDFVSALELPSTPLISCNGAVVTVGPEFTPIYRQNLSYADALRTMELGESLGTTMLIWADTLYSNASNELVERYRRSAKTSPIQTNDYKWLAEMGVRKVLWFDADERIAAFQKELPDDYALTMNYFTSCSYFLEFVDKNVSKGIGIQKLCEHFNIDPSETISFGDDNNDLAMIEYAGLGVAMENAREEIKAAADYVTLSNDRDGVAAAIRKFIL